MANEKHLADQDILAAFEGRPAHSDECNQKIVNILNGTTPTKPVAERAADRAILAALEGKSLGAVIGAGEVRASEEDNMWLSRLGVDSAAESLRLAYMGQHPGMQAREVGNAADSKIAELYAEAAKNTKYEAERLDYVEHQAKRLASDIRGGH